MKLYYSYLGPQILSGFDSYKYSSKDTSPLSNYVMHPFWNQVNTIPCLLGNDSSCQYHLSDCEALPQMGGPQPPHPCWLSLLFRPLWAAGPIRLRLPVSHLHPGRRQPGDRSGLGLVPGGSLPFSCPHP